MAKKDRPRWNNRLVVHAVDDATNIVYEREVRAFLVDCKRGEVAFRTLEQRDRALGNYISDLCYLKGDNYMKASLTFNGFMHIFEDHRGKLPTAHRALKSWERMQFGGEGHPIPFQAMGVIIMRMLEMGHLLEGCACIVQLDGWLREQDWEMLRARHVSFTPSGGVGLKLGDRMIGQKTKTGANQGAVLEWPLSRLILKALVGECEPDDQVFPFTQPSFRRIWLRTLKDVGLEKMGPPHGMRHAAAARFVALNGDLEAARRRGRWASTAGLQRYTKCHVLVEKLGELDAAQLKAGCAFWRRPCQATHDAIVRGPGAGTPLGKCLIEALAAAREREVPVPMYGS